LLKTLANTEGECGMVLREVYNKQYITLRDRISQIKSKAMYAASKAKRAKQIEMIDKAAKELDARYFDEMTLDVVEENIDAIDKQTVNAK
jgi:hypothetical protein